MKSLKKKHSVKRYHDSFVEKHTNLLESSKWRLLTEEWVSAITGTPYAFVPMTSPTDLYVHKIGALKGPNKVYTPFKGSKRSPRVHLGLWENLVTGKVESPTATLIKIKLAFVPSRSKRVLNVGYLKVMRKAVNLKYAK